MFNKDKEEIILFDNKKEISYNESDNINVYSKIAIIIVVVSIILIIIYYIYYRKKSISLYKLIYQK